MREILEKYDRVITEFDDKFFKRVTSSFERTIWNAIENILGLFTQKDGKFADRKANTTVFMRIDKSLKRAFRQSEMKSIVDSLITDFDLAESLSKEYYSTILSNKEFKEVKTIFKSQQPYKRDIIDNLVRSLTDYDTFRAGALREIQNEIYRGIVFNSSVAELRDSIRRAVITTEGNNSQILRYSKQIANDSLMIYQRTLHQNTAIEMELDGFMFVNSIIETSRQSCKDMVNGTGAVADLAIAPGQYRIEDIPEIVKRLRGSSGWNPNTTPENYLAVLNGYGCRHAAIPFRILE